MWKEIIKDLFPEFLEFFMPEIYKDVDLSKGYEFLDSELENIAFKIRKGKKIADKLIKVYMKNGEENWLLIHVEVQGYEDEEFAERMFKYFYRIYDEYSKKITAISIFTDTNSIYEPNEYIYSCYETSLVYKYKSYKVINQREEDLINSENPFSMIVLAAYYTAKTEGKRDDNERYIFKKNLAKLLLKKSYTRDRIVKILKFIESLVYVKREYEKLFIEDLKEMVGGAGKVIPIELTNAYRAGVEEGIEEGIEIGKQEGKEEGIEIGKEEGIEIGKEEGIEKVALSMFRNGMTIEMVEKITGLNIEKITGILKKLNSN